MTNGNSGLITNVVPRGATGLPRAPHDIDDAVKLWARKSGRGATMHFFPPAGWFTRLELRAADPVRKFAGDSGGEDVFFHVKNVYEGQVLSLQEVQADRRYKNLPLIDWWGGIRVRMPTYLQLDVLQLGASGVTAFLEREDTWSGRGQYESLDKAVKGQMELDEQGKEKLRDSMEWQAGKRALDFRRTIAKIPYLGVLFGKSRPGNRKE